MVRSAGRRSSAARLHSRPQPEEGVTYATKIARPRRRIDWARRRARCDGQIRGLVAVSRRLVRAAIDGERCA